MIQREFTAQFKIHYMRFRKSMHALLASLRNTASHSTIVQQTDGLFLRLSELRRVGELMERSESPDEIVKSAPPGYFIDRAQCHQSFYGTEFGYSCWYIKATMGYIVSGLERGNSPKLLADSLERILANFNMQKLKLFPRSLPFELEEPMLTSVQSGSQSPSSSESSCSTTTPSVSNELYESNNPPPSIPFSSEYQWSSDSSAVKDPFKTPAQSPNKIYAGPPNTPSLSTDSIEEQAGLRHAEIFAELARRANELTLSFGSDHSRSSSRRRLSRSPRRLRTSATSAGKQRRRNS